MKSAILKKNRPIGFEKVEINDEFWAPRIRTNLKVTLPLEYELCKSTGRIDAWRWMPGAPNEPHVFWDSDVAKWVEAAAYSLVKEPNPELERLIDEYVDMMAEAQGDDGYLNSHFLRVEPEKKWTNLHHDHELYCAGHLMEAAVAYHQATGKRKFLDLICRYADLICDVFGAAPGKNHGYSGHPEIELALVKLFSATGEEKYLRLSRFFLLERGTTPNYFELEVNRLKMNLPFSGFKYLQAHKPLLEQETAEGHAVRALYLYTGMADVAAETGDQRLREACQRLWRNVTTKRMYVTGGVGPSPNGEMFTFDYDLPNETAYAETCAAIALVFFARAMLSLENDAGYADVMERSLYNGVLSGVGLDGKHFFYANPLAATPRMNEFLPEHRKTIRQEWFGCSCCPPNIARILASLGGYAYFEDENELTVNLYIAGTAEFALAETDGTLEVETNYPWDGDVQLTMRLTKPAGFALRLRLPEWCDSPSLEVNGEVVDFSTHTTNGYVCVDREWKDGDAVRLILPMQPQLIVANPAVRQDAGRAAIQRGPMVYCLEEVDNGQGLDRIIIPSDAGFTETTIDDLPSGVVALQCEAYREIPTGWDAKLYRDIREVNDKLEKITVTAIPYHLWSNREPGEMIVFARTRE